MIIYSDTKTGFLGDILDGVLDEKLESLMRERFGKGTPEGELRAWRNSLTYMGNIIGQSSIPDDSGIAIEYGIPYTSKRVDLIVTGLNEYGGNSAVIIELKQWDSAEAVPWKDGVVRTVVGGGIHEVTHPSYQAWSYAEAIEDFNADVRTGEWFSHHAHASTTTSLRCPIRWRPTSTLSTSRRPPCSPSTRGPI